MRAGTKKRLRLYLAQPHAAYTARMPLIFARDIASRPPRPSLVDVEMPSDIAVYRLLQDAGDIAAHEPDVVLETVFAYIFH